MKQDIGLLIMRMLAGVGMVYHGAGKIFIGRMDGFIQAIGGMGLPFPEVLAWCAALSEFCGGLCLILGFFTRWAALFIFLTMSVAAFVKHGSDPFSQKELALAYWTLCAGFLFTGPGRFRLDYFLFRLKS